MTAAATLDLQNLVDDLGKAAKDAPKSMDNYLIQAANEIQRLMRMYAPVKTGRLRDSIVVQVQPGRVIIGPVGVAYAAYVEYGTKPHTIRPKKPGGVLVFQMGDGTVFAREVHHPGTKARPFARLAAQEYLDELGTNAARVGVEMITS